MVIVVLRGGGCRWVEVRVRVRRWWWVDEGRRVEVAMVVHGVWVEMFERLSMRGEMEEVFWLVAALTIGREAETGSGSRRSEWRR